jgi:hypothetical protein
MQLMNFSIVGQEGIGIEIEAFGCIWNLHACPFLRMQHSIEEAKVELEWGSNELMHPQSKYPASCFAIVFHNVSQFEVSARDREMPLEEDLCLEFVSGVHAPAILAETIYHSYSPTIPLGPNFLLFFTFRGGQRILVGADRAEFVLLNADNERTTQAEKNTLKESAVTRI